MMFAPPLSQWLLNVQLTNPRVLEEPIFTTFGGAIRPSLYDPMVHTHLQEPDAGSYAER
jgi:hypothetical protein